MQNDYDRQITGYITIKQCSRSTLFHEQADYQNFLSHLGRIPGRFGLSLHAFALMPDHVCLLLTAVRKILVIRALDMLELDYADYYNFYYRRLEKILEFDYSMLPVDAAHHLLQYSRYIEMAPVRAGLTRHPSDYPWSSYACNALGEDAGILTPHAQYLALGADAQSQRSAYRALLDVNGMSAGALQGALV